MSIRPVSEKAAELFFGRSMLQVFPLGRIELFVPSSAEEFVVEYNGKTDTETVV